MSKEVMFPPLPSQKGVARQETDVLGNAINGLENRS
jgi:hypothetical protein